MILTSLKLVNFGSPQLIDTKRLFSTFSTSASLVIGNIWSRRIAFRNQFFSKSQRPIDSKPTPKTFFDHNQYKIRCQTQNCSLQKMTLHLFVPTNSRKFDKLEKTQHFYSSSSCVSKKTFVFAHFTRQNFFFQKHAENQRTKLIFSKWAKISLYNFGLFQQVFENLKLNKLAKEERRFGLRR